jgi:hypothetical protein
MKWTCARSTCSATRCSQRALRADAWPTRSCGTSRRAVASRLKRGRLGGVGGMCCVQGVGRCSAVVEERAPARQPTPGGADLGAAPGARKCRGRG